MTEKKPVYTIITKSGRAENCSEKGYHDILTSIGYGKGAKDLPHALMRDGLVIVHDGLMELGLAYVEQGRRLHDEAEAARVALFPEPDPDDESDHHEVNQLLMDAFNLIDPWARYPTNDAGASDEKTVQSSFTYGEARKARALSQKIQRILAERL